LPAPEKMCLGRRAACTSVQSRYQKGQLASRRPPPRGPNVWWVLWDPPSSPPSEIQPHRRHFQAQ
jgi:hypothetical protein